jgi:hypothetical protein
MSEYESSATHDSAGREFQTTGLLLLENGRGSEQCVFWDQPSRQVGRCLSVQTPEDNGSNFDLHLLSEGQPAQFS